VGAASPRLAGLGTGLQSAAWVHAMHGSPCRPCEHLMERIHRGCVMLVLLAALTLLPSGWNQEQPGAMAASHPLHRLVLGPAPAVVAGWPLPALDAIVQGGRRRIVVPLRRNAV
jgi:hypothetical protein